MRTFFSLLLALIIVLAFGTFAVFYVNISNGAKFERTDKVEEKPEES